MRSSSLMQGFNMEEHTFDKKSTSETKKTDDSSQSHPQQNSDEKSFDAALQTCQNELQEWKEKYMRLAADYQNYTKRIAKEQASYKRSAQAAILYDVLNILDNFERALEGIDISKVPLEMKAWVEGIELIKKELHKMLEKYSVRPMQESKVFDPHLHEAVMHVESEKHASGEIVQVLQQGYLINGEVLRTAKVSIAK